MPANHPARRLEVSVLPEERAAIKKAAQEAGLSVSEWVRKNLDIRRVMSRYGHRDEHGD